jgi:hypothetical protein
MRFPDGREIENNQTYTLAVSGSMVAGAGGFSMLQWLPREDVRLSDVDALAAYLPRLRQPVEAPAENRFHASR